MSHDDWICTHIVNMFYKYPFSRNVTNGETNNTIYSKKNNILIKPARRTKIENRRISLSSIRKYWKTSGDNFLWCHPYDMTLDYCGNKYLMTKRTVKGEISMAVKCSQTLSKNIMTGYISYQLTNHTPLSTMFCFTIHVRNLMRNIFSSYFISFFQKIEYVFFVW